MLIIRKQQMETLGESSLEVFLDRIVALFREEFPDESESISQQQMKHEFKGLVEQGRDYGFRTEKEVFTYLWSAKYLGSDFPRVYPEAEEIMSSPQLTPETKTLWLQKWTLAVLEARSEG
jgi:hypothetical protein